jgi:hypothetical protein
MIKFDSFSFNGDKQIVSSILKNEVSGTMLFGGVRRNYGPFCFSLPAVVLLDGSVFRTVLELTCLLGP